MFLRHRRLVAYVIITAAAACGDLTSPPLPLASINISRDSATLVPGGNRTIRGLAAQRGVKLVDISAFTSDDDGLTWKRPSLHVADGTHYAEEVRDWIAARVLEIMAAGILRRV